MNSLEKGMILTPIQKLSKNVRDLGKLIVAKGFEKLHKVQLIDQSSHTVHITQRTSNNPLTFHHNVTVATAYLGPW